MLPMGDNQYVEDMSHPHIVPFFKPPVAADSLPWQVLLAAL